MQLKDLEALFNRAFKGSYTKKKLFFIAPVLLVCGILTVFCRVLAFGAGKWVLMSLTFLPIFLCSGVLLAAGVILIRMYHNEIKSLATPWKKLLTDSWEVMIGVSYLALPLVLAYLFLWTLLGVFYLFAEIPVIGAAISAILSFGPFLLVLGSLALSLISLHLLFFVTPYVALKSGVKFQLAEDILRRLYANPFRSFLFLCLALLPIVLSLGLLVLAASLTDLHFLGEGNPLSIGLEWFFVMVPFATLLSPSIIFFFNFAAEAFVYMRREEKMGEAALEEQISNL